MSNRKRSKGKGQATAPTTVRFTPQVLDVLAQHAKATGLSVSHVANVMILTGHHATAGNVSVVNATRKLLGNYVLAHREDVKAAAKRASLNKGIREAKAVLSGRKEPEQKTTEQKTNAA